VSLGKSIRSGVSWLLLGSIGQYVSKFIFGVMLARLLVPADFGLLLTVSVFTGVASIITSGGMGQSLIRAKEVENIDFYAVFSLQLALCLVWYAVFFIASPYIAHYFQEPIYTDLIRVSALVFLLKPFTYMRMAWLNREMQFKKYSLIGLASGLFSGIASITMAWNGMGVWSLIFAGILGTLFTNVALSFATPLRLRLSSNTSIMKKHTSFGIKITILGIISYLSKESKSLIISKLVGPGFLGAFNKGESLSLLPNRIVVPSTMQPVFRAMSKIQDDLDQTKYMLYRSIMLLTVYTAPLYIGLWWVAESFILTVYGEKWFASIEPLRILVLAGFLLNIQHPCGVLLEAQNKLTQQIIVHLLKLVLLSTSVFFGVKWGYSGVAYAIVVSIIFVTFAQYYLVYRTISTKIIDLIKALLPGLTLGVFLFVMFVLVDVIFSEIFPPSSFISLICLS